MLKLAVVFLNFLRWSLKLYRFLSDRVENYLRRLIPKKRSTEFFAILPSRNKKENLILNQRLVNRFRYEMKTVPGMIGAKEEDLLLHLSLFAKVRGDVLEIGSWLGRSTLFLAKGCCLSGNGRVIAIDTFKGNPGKEHLYTAPLKKGETIYQRFLLNTRRLKLNRYISVYRMSSREARKVIDTKSVRLIFIDACHEYKAVVTDIELWQDLLITGGYLVLHDFRRELVPTTTAIYEKVISSDIFKVLLIENSTIVAEKIK